MHDNDSLDLPFLVVTGSSAGGIEPLRGLITSLPADLNASVVIAQHLDPTHKSRLAEILSQHGPLQVKLVSARQELEPGVVYVVPSNHDVQIVDSAARAYIEGRQGAKPSIDRLFASAAEQYGDRVVAIILSGMGSDGLLGAQAVKEHGGTVIIQDPQTASYPSLPMAIPPTLIDIVARPEAMGAIVGGLVRGTAMPTAPAEQNVLRTLLVQLRDSSGIDFLQYKTPTIMRRLSRLMIASGTETVAEYARYLQAHPEGYQKLISAFLIKVTEFFRDAALFQELKDDILPKIINAARSRGDELRVWSAGTSTGEEAYSIAILCAEIMRDQGERVHVRIFATDLDEEAIGFARRGLYAKEALRNIPPSWVDRYFVKVGDAYEVSKLIRNMTVFGRHDLAQRSPFPRTDLCLCRNVLIYFTKELQTRALQLFAFSLRDGGYLILGKAESTTPLQQYFRTVNSAIKIYERTGDRILIPPTRMKDPVAAIPDVRSSQRAVREALALASPRVDFRPNSNEAIGSFLFQSAIGVVLVDKRYDILAINPAARNLLEIHGVGVGEDLIHSVETLDRDALRGLIDAAQRGEPADSPELQAGETASGNERWLKIGAQAEHTFSSRVDGVAVFIIDVTDSVKSRKELEKRASESEQHVRELSARVGELQARQRSLLQANDELTAANSELRTVNEQLLIHTEESASANEEIETLNEEMQATNEELETLNEELQATVEELNTTNDELGARGSELERLNAESETSLFKARLEREALLATMDGPGNHFAIVHDGEVLYRSPGLEGSSFLKQSPERWTAARELALADGTKLEVSNRTASVDGEIVQIFLMHERKET